MRPRSLVFRIAFLLLLAGMVGAVRSEGPAAHPSRGREAGLPGGGKPIPPDHESGTTGGLSAGDDWLG